MTVESAVAIPKLAAPAQDFAPVLRPKRQKTTASQVMGAMLRRVINPVHLWRAGRLQINRKAHRHTYDDAQLALYAKIFPGDFLHFGYFENAELTPDETRLADVTRAQIRYAELVLDLAAPNDLPALDVGCGMGGLSRMLLARGYAPTALTPDRMQAAHIQATMPNVPVIRTKLEKMPTADYLGRFGTIFTAESLQYLKLDQALPVLSSVLAPGGRWVACDFFHNAPSADRSCHVWDEFTQKLDQGGWKISYQRDITAHVLPTLRYAHMWGARFGVPLMQFGFLRLRRKAPGLHHLFADAYDKLESMAKENLSIIDPDKFSREKQYMLLMMEKK